MRILIRSKQEKGTNMPTLTTTKLTLPGGGKLEGFPTLAAQTAACSAATNLLAQAAPLLATMRCQSKVLNLLRPLIDIIKALPNPPVQAVQNFAKAAEDLEPCLLITTPATLLPLIRDLICLEIRALTCFLNNLKAAQSRPRTLPAVLSSYAPIVNPLNLAASVFAAAELQLPKPPALSGDIAADTTAVKTFIATLQSAADALGGC
jgi:hypothetical protein